RRAAEKISDLFCALCCCHWPTSAHRNRTAPSPINYCSWRLHVNASARRSCFARFVRVQGGAWASRIGPQEHVRSVGVNTPYVGTPTFHSRATEVRWIWLGTFMLGRSFGDWSADARGAGLR